jgi:hypothetical protein
MMMESIQRKRLVSFSYLIQSLNKVWIIAGWELKHISSNRFNLILGGAAFCFFTGLLWVRNQWGEVLGTTILGQMAELVYDLLLIMGILLPFLAADRVAHDYHERIHELLMSTAVPTRLYVLGRYLATLAISLSLAVIMLMAQLIANLAFPLFDSHFPMANPGFTLVLWIRIALPASILVGSLCFCLGTLFPRFTAVPKLGICLAWIILALDTDPTDLSWRVYWNPTGAGMITQIVNQYQVSVQRAMQNVTGPAAMAGVTLRLQQIMPDLHPWSGPFLALVAMGLLLGLLTAFGFRRFSQSING